jgi:predicted site-specific integrase-resolvase
LRSNIFYLYYTNKSKKGGAQKLLFSVNEEKEKTIELAEDLVAIVTSFAAKIYGKIGSKNK